MVDPLYNFFIAAVTVKADDIGKIASQLFDFRGNNAVLQAGPDICSEGLHRIFCPDHIEASLQNLAGTIRAHGKAWLIINVPTEDSVIISVSADCFLNKGQEFFLKFRIFVVMIAGQLLFLFGQRESALVVAQSIALFAHFLGHKSFAHRQVFLVGEDNHYLLSIFGAQRNIALKHLHIGLRLCIINIEVSPDADAVKANFLAEGQFPLGGCQFLFRFVLLKHIQPIGTVASDKVAAPQPTHFFIPGICLLARPSFFHSRISFQKVLIIL